MSISSDFKDKQRYLAQMRVIRHRHVLRGISIYRGNNYF